MIAFANLTIVQCSLNEFETVLSGGYTVKPISEKRVKSSCPLIRAFTPFTANQPIYFRGTIDERSQFSLSNFSFLDQVDKSHVTWNFMECDRDLERNRGKNRNVR